MHTQQLPIYLESYRLTQAIFQITVKFPKEYKFMLGTGLNESVLDLCVLISQANHKADKTPVLDEFLSTLERIKLQLRLCTDFKLLSCQQQANLAISLDKITQQAIAWLKSERRKQLP